MQDAYEFDEDLGDENLDGTALLPRIKQLAELETHLLRCGKLRVLLLSFGIYMKWYMQNRREIL